MLTHNQDRAVAFGNAGDRALNLRLNRGKLSGRSERFRLPFCALDGCTARHEGTWIHVPALAMRLPNLSDRTRNVHSMRHIHSWEHFQEERLLRGRKGFSLLAGRIVTLISQESGKSFPLARQSWFRMPGNSWRIHLDGAVPLSASRLLRRSVYRTEMPQVPLRRIWPKSYKRRRLPRILGFFETLALHGVRYSSARSWWRCTTACWRNW